LRYSPFLRLPMDITPGQPQLECLRRLIALARNEDLGDGDVTGAVVPESTPARGRFVAREGLVFCGGALLGEIAAAYDEGIETACLCAEGERAEAGAVPATWEGPARSILAAERVALNFLQRLCGIATLTRAYVDAVAGTAAEIYDTRKTAPGWRALEKYAVRAGGGRNHRMGLYDAVLVKDNHLALLGPEAPAKLRERLKELRKSRAPAFIEVEVDTLEQLVEALKLPVDVVLLDNMSPEQLARAVRMRDKAGAKGSIALEASGKVTLETVRRVAETGVERIAVGAITHSAPAVDISLEVRPAQDGTNG